MSKMIRMIAAISALAAAIFLCSVSKAFAQDAVPTEILQRTLYIRVGSMTGTSFVIDYQGKLYVVTAKHMVEGLPQTNANIQVRQGSTWKDLHTVRILFPPSSDVDIAVLETGDDVSTPFRIRPAEGTHGVTLGQQVWFLGYPWGIGSQFPNAQLPFIKRGTMSAIDATNPDAVVLYIDGFNNPGFSGGPIIYYEFKAHVYEILGVVKGYREDTAKLFVNGQQANTNILVNSGILIGYDIKHAIQAIEKGKPH